MNVKRYVARTAREALSQVRADLGADAVVLANRPVPGGVEILAMAEAALPGQPAAPTPVARAATTKAHGATPDGGPMSTVDFQSYVRERQQRRSQAAPAADGADDGAPSARPDARAHGGIDARTRGIEARVDDGADIRVDRDIDARARRDGGLDDSHSRAGADGTAELMAELRAMRGFIAEQIGSVSWFEGVRRRPAQARLLRWLLRTGFSASLSRTLVGRLPADIGDAQAERWLHEALQQELPCAAPAQTIFDDGGVFALLGPTGVGKTTTAAKIAAQFALRHGAQSVGLITADVYRVGAQDQLRTFGRLLGVPVHVAHDVTGLTDFLQLFMNRKLVLIDTAGVGQRDERVRELLAALSSTQVRRVLVIDAAMQAEAIDEVATAYQAGRAAGVVLSKVDEAVQLGGALDCLIRRRLELQGVADGQRVPEDWHRPDVGALVERALACAGDVRPTPFSFDDAELAMLMAARPVHAASALAEARSV
ncbi:MAG: flagellar biosynthesis protein FlhF [Burkholderiaceae bacterium]|nr:flagellar biosynthesis protein FlhF [Burkholderiaceae bacterium]